MNQLSSPHIASAHSLSDVAVQIAVSLTSAKHPRPSLIITPTASNAEQLHSELTTFLEGGSFYKGWAHSPYSSQIPSMADRFGRLALLKSIQSKQMDWLVTDVNSLFQPTIPPQELQSQTKVISPGDILSRAQLEDLLCALGYSKTDLVETKGTYALRGFLLDVFSPQHAKPHRIEFFDDTVESILSFDSETQRSLAAPSTSFELIPCHEWVSFPEQINKSTQRIKAFADDRGLSKKSRDLIFDQLSASVRDPFFDYLLPFFWGQCGTLNAYTSHWHSVVVWPDRVQAELLGRAEDLRQQYESKQDHQTLLCPPEMLFGNAKSNLGSLPPTQLTFNLGASLLTPDLPQAGPNADERLDSFVELFRQQREQGLGLATVVTSEGQSDRLSQILTHRKVPFKKVTRIEPFHSNEIQILVGALADSVNAQAWGTLIVSQSFLFPAGPRQRRDSSQDVDKSKVAHSFMAIEDLTAGDLVVHRRHGVGRFLGLTSLTALGILQDYILLEYQGGDKLYLPVYRLDQIQKHSATSDQALLDRLGSPLFEEAKTKVKSELKSIAQDLIRLYASRTIRRGSPYSLPDESFREFEGQFPFQETPDQSRAVTDVLSDMASDKIMDRLICGDVGFGKTEVAMRAAFKAVSDGYQVAVLVPTTVLALQHERSFQERFKEWPMSVRGISRFKSRAEVQQTLTQVADGSLDILIGTHRLLSKDVQFKNLRLLIIDEEQRFGVEHKEKLKILKANTDAITLTATPIPRTLQMSFMGMRDISIISTPPVDRQSIKTTVMAFDIESIRDAIGREIQRGGQVYYVHNRVHDITEVGQWLQGLVPQARIGIAHGQMAEGDLEKVMLGFYQREFNILVCTTIIESGLDVPSANTMIIDRADTFGLAQLYQLRGRVGRSQIQAYAYLLLPAHGHTRPEALQRIEIIQRFVELGSGFKVASHDLELRGGGDILGKSQSGSIARVGMEMYSELLEEALGEIRGQPPSEVAVEPEIRVPVTAVLPTSYITSPKQRLALYRRLSQAKTAQDLELLRVEVVDRFGPLPEHADNLFHLIRIKQILLTNRIKSVTVNADRIILEASEKTTLAHDRLMDLVHKEPQFITLLPDSKLSLFHGFINLYETGQTLWRFFSQVAPVNT